jgi:ubiquinone/menaquinone biosynthesis C-methylase UbiE
MSFLDYFSKDATTRAKFIFNSIARIYSKVDHTLIESYEESIEVVNKKIDITGLKVLDIGSGTGAWAMKFVEHQASEVYGIDFSDKMLKVGKEKHPEIQFSLGDAENLFEISDNSFDIVTASFVVHGVKEERRDKILSEMKRITRNHVILHDFVGKTPFFVRFLEFLEQSDYKHFKTNICTELQEKFSKVEKIQTDFGSGLYIAIK